MRCEIVQGNAYIINNEIHDWEQRRSWYNRVITMGCEDTSENMACENIWRDGTHKPVSIPPTRGVHGASKLDWVTVWFF